MSGSCQGWAALAVAGCLAAAGVVRPADAPTSPRVRTFTFTFTYEATLTDLKPGQAVRLWLPVPPDNDDQEVSVVRRDLPAEGRIRTEKPNGNRVLYLEARADGRGEVPVRMVYRVRRRELRRDRPPRDADDAAELARLRRPDRLVPVTGKPLELLQGKRLPEDETELARFLYDRVLAHMRYSKEGDGWGRGDAAWACASGRGNCTDFHSLFVSLARSRGLPARFEVGFALPPRRRSGDVAGYHCWAKVHPRGGWLPLDLAEASKDPRRRDYCFGNLSEDRVTFSTGRDPELVPRQAGPPLNFFVYPYAEVDGAEHPPSKVRRHFSFRDE